MYNITIIGTKELSNKLKKIGDHLGSREMLDYLADKFERTLYKVTNENLTTVEDLETSEYAKNHKKEVQGNKIILSNSTMADLSGLSPETLANYPNGFSIAKAVEFGTGIIGATSSANSIAQRHGWEYDVNQHGDRGWYYKKDGNLYWSKGFEGRLIYYKTKREILENLSKWIGSYMKSKIK